MEYGCIGEKLSHSFSKIIHGKLTDYKYELKEIAKEDLDSFLKTADFKAINVTIPYKQAVIPYLYYISETAKKIGAVNTVVNKNGKLYGYNTDFLGLSALIKKQNLSLQNKKVLILGSGGTSKTAKVVAEDLGAKTVLRVSRNALDGAITYEEAYTHTDTYAIINTTPVGMYPNIGKSSIELSKFKNLSLVVDAVYNPLSSKLITDAKSLGIKAEGGLYMLVAQAVFAAEKFIETKFDQTEIDRIFGEILLDKKNIVLTGMPSCGKTTIGRLVAENLGKTFIDTDEEIIKKAGMPIPEIFEKFGEERFRQIESEVIKEISALQSSVIATGGGAVLNPLNIAFLKENGTIVFIDRPLEKLITTDDRPLSSSRELLEKRYKERYGIYNSTCDIKIDAVDDLNQNITAVKEAFLSENFSN